MLKKLEKTHQKPNKNFKKLFTNSKECGIICLYDVDPVVGYEVA